MKLSDAETLAQDLFAQHGLKKWTFQFDRAKVRFGLCNFCDRVISLSRHLTELNDEAIVRNTILHEIAHALVGRRHAHDKVWKAKAIEIGCDGARRYHSGSINTPALKYSATCSSCTKIYQSQRKRARVACGICCKTHNRGKFSDQFRLTFSESLAELS